MASCQAIWQTTWGDWCLKWWPFQLQGINCFALEYFLVIIAYRTMQMRWMCWSHLTTIIYLHTFDVSKSFSVGQATFANTLHSVLFSLILNGNKEGFRRWKCISRGPRHVITTIFSQEKYALHDKSIYFFYEPQELSEIFRSRYNTGMGSWCYR